MRWARPSSRVRRRERQRPQTTSPSAPRRGGLARQRTGRDRSIGRQAEAELRGERGRANQPAPPRRAPLATRCLLVGGAVAVTSSRHPPGDDRARLARTHDQRPADALQQPRERQRLGGRRLVVRASAPRRRPARSRAPTAATARRARSDRRAAVPPAAPRRAGRASPPRPPRPAGNRPRRRAAARPCSAIGRHPGSGLRRGFALRWHEVRGIGRRQDFQQRCQPFVELAHAREAVQHALVDAQGCLRQRRPVAGLDQPPAAQRRIGAQRAPVRLRQRAERQAEGRVRARRVTRGRAQSAAISASSSTPAHSSSRSRSNRDRPNPRAIRSSAGGCPTRREAQLLPQLARRRDA